MSFKGIQPGDKVKFLQYAGLGRNGPEFKEKVAPVNPMLIFPAHVVVNIGGRFGAIAQYVGEGQFYDEGDEEPVDLSYYDFAVYSHAGVTA